MVDFPFMSYFEKVKLNASSKTVNSLNLPDEHSEKER